MVTFTRVLLVLLVHICIIQIVCKVVDDVLYSHSARGLYGVNQSLAADPTTLHLYFYLVGANLKGTSFCPFESPFHCASPIQISIHPLFVLTSSAKYLLFCCGRSFFSHRPSSETVPVQFMSNNPSFFSVRKKAFGRCLVTEEPDLVSLSYLVVRFKVY